MIDIQNFTQLLAQNLAKYLALVVRVLNFHLSQSQLPFGINKVHYQQGTDPLFHNGSGAMFISRKKLSNRVMNRVVPRAARGTSEKNKLFPSCRATKVRHLHICPRKFCMSIVFSNFTCDGCDTQEK